MISGLSILNMIYCITPLFWYSIKFYCCRSSSYMAVFIQYNTFSQSIFTICLSFTYSHTSYTLLIVVDAGCNETLSLKSRGNSSLSVCCFYNMKCFQVKQDGRWSVIIKIWFGLLKSRHDLTNMVWYGAVVDSLPPPTHREAEDKGEVKKLNGWG